MWIYWGVKIMIKIINKKMYMELENYEISCSIDLNKYTGRKKDNEKTMDVTFPMEVTKFKDKIERLGFNPKTDIGSCSCVFNMFVGYNYDELPEGKALTDYNLIALVFEDINKMGPKQRLRYEQNAGIYNSFMHAAAIEFTTDEDVEYFHNVLDTNEFPNQKLRKRISNEYEESYYLAGVIRRSLESGKDYFSEDVNYF